LLLICKSLDEEVPTQQKSQILQENKQNKTNQNTDLTNAEKRLDGMYIHECLKIFFNSYI